MIRLLALLFIASTSSAQIVNQEFPAASCPANFVVIVKCVDDEVTLPEQSTKQPRILFTDIDSGPLGLNDGQGQGAIVTIWGQNLGHSQKLSKVSFTDSAGNTNDCIVYYWKNADGQLPSGPANLYESHQMQEIACSIPSSALGLGSLSANVDGVNSNKLPFTVRTGNIYYVHPDGDNNNDCSWAKPCAYINGGYRYSGKNKGLGNERLKAGDIVYSRGVLEANNDKGANVGLFLRKIEGTESHPVSLIAYPNTRAKVSAANRGVHPYVSSYINVSKFAIEVGYAPTDAPISAGSTSNSNAHIKAQQGRYVGNRMSQIEGTCFTGWSGAIVSNGLGGDGIKVYGNHFDNLGCDNSSRYQHTLYLSNRTPNANIKAWEVSYNYLDNNNVFYGIHAYDETIYNGGDDCDWDVSGTMRINNNVIVNQRGAGINIGTRDNNGDKNKCWTADIEIQGNVLVNVGLGMPQENGVANPDAIRVTGALYPNTVTITNNTVHGYGEFVSLEQSKGYAINVDLDIANPVVTVKNNAFVQTTKHKNLQWLKIPSDANVTNNSFFNTLTKDDNNAPVLSNSIYTDPLISVNNNQIKLNSNSPLVDSALGLTYYYDIYGNSQTNSIGAVQQ